MTTDSLDLDMPCCRSCSRAIDLGDVCDPCWHAEQTLLADIGALDVGEPDRAVPVDCPHCHLPHNEFGEICSTCLAVLAAGGIP